MKRDFIEWLKIIRDIERTGEYYDKVNNIISFGYGDKLREIILDDVKKRVNVLDAGIGPGSLSRKIMEKNSKVYLVGLDASYDLLIRALSQLSNFIDRCDLVAGLFENPPFREGIFDAIYSAYAIRDALEIDKAIFRLSRLLKEDGVLIDIDIGKPDNLLIRILLKLYMVSVVPILASLISKKLNNPWWGLGKTLNRLPLNKEMVKIFGTVFSKLELDFYAFSTLYVFKGYK